MPAFVNRIGGEQLLPLNGLGERGRSRQRDCSVEYMYWAGMVANSAHVVFTLSNPVTHMVLYLEPLLHLIKRAPMMASAPSEVTIHPKRS